MLKMENRHKSHKYSIIVVNLSLSQMDDSSYRLNFDLGKNEIVLIKGRGYIDYILVKFGLKLDKKYPKIYIFSRTEIPNT